MTDKYEDIIHLPHHVSKKYPQMPVSDRAAQFTGRDSVIRDAEWLDELFFDSLIRANILNIVSEFQKTWNQSDIGGNMTGGSTSGKYDSFHIKTSRKNVLVSRLQRK